MVMIDIGISLMKIKPLKELAIGILGGIAIAALICALIRSGLIAKESHEALIKTTVKVCIGLIVLIVDLLCAWGLLRPALTAYIERNGVDSEGKIESVQTIAAPNRAFADEWIDSMRFSLRISYTVAGKRYTKEFPPTPHICKRELYPNSLEVGETLKLKCCEKFPSFALIDIDAIKTREQADSKKSRIHLIMLPLIITAVTLWQ